MLQTHVTRTALGITGSLVSTFVLQFNIMDWLFATMNRFPDGNPNIKGNWFAWSVSFKNFEKSWRLATLSRGCTSLWTTEMKFVPGWGFVCHCSRWCFWEERIHTLDCSSLNCWRNCVQGMGIRYFQLVCREQCHAWHYLPSRQLTTKDEDRTIIQPGSSWIPSGWRQVDT